MKERHQSETEATERFIEKLPAEMKQRSTVSLPRRRPLTPTRNEFYLEDKIAEETQENSASKSSSVQDIKKSGSSSQKPKKTKKKPMENIEEDDDTKSFESYNTQDLEEFRIKQSRVSKMIMVGVLFANLALNLTLLSLIILYNNKNKSDDSPDTKFGFENAMDSYRTIALIFTILYSLMIFTFAAVFIRILRLFHKAYPDLFMIVRCKIWTFLLIYEFFLISRALNYAYRQIIDVKWVAKTPNMSDKAVQTEYYFSECILIGLLIFVGFSGQQKEEDQINEYPELGQVRKSFVAVGGYLR